MGFFLRGSSYLLRTKLIAPVQTSLKNALPSTVLELPTSFKPLHDHALSHPADEDLPEHHSLNLSTIPASFLKLQRTSDTQTIISRCFVSSRPTLNRLSYRGYSSRHSVASTVASTPYEPDFSSVRRDGGKSSPEQEAQQDPRLFTYFMVGTAGVFSAVAAKSVVADFVTSLSAAGDQLAQAQSEVDLSGIPKGKNVIVKWRGKPIFIRHRTASEIEDMQAVNVTDLRDPQHDHERVKKPEWLVMLGICTHLGCVPLGDSGDFAHGWYCPCHGSHYDVSGRIRKGPAPLNLEIPKYNFIDDTTILIG